VPGHGYLFILDPFYATKIQRSENGNYFDSKVECSLRSRRIKGRGRGKGKRILLPHPPPLYTPATQARWNVLAPTIF